MLAFAWFGLLEYCELNLHYFVIFMRISISMIELINNFFGIKKILRLIIGINYFHLQKLLINRRIKVFII